MQTRVIKNLTTHKYYAKQYYNNSNMSPSYTKRKILEKIQYEQKLLKNYNKVVKHCNPTKNHLMTHECVVTWKEIENLHLILERLNHTLCHDNEDFTDSF